MSTGVTCEKVKRSSGSRPERRSPERSEVSEPPVHQPPTPPPQQRKVVSTPATVSLNFHHMILVYHFINSEFKLISM